MSSPTDPELLAEVTALRKQLAAIQSQMAAHRRAKDVATALAQVGKELAESLDVAQVTDRIVTTIMRLVGGRRAALFEHVPASGDLICVATAPGRRSERWLGRRLPPGEGVAGRAVAEGQPVWSSDLLADPRIRLPEFWRERLEEEGYRAAIGLPLIARGTVIGALVLSDVAGRVFSEDDRQILTIFADQAAMAVEKARLFAELNQSYHDLQQAQDELIRSEKLRALGQMAAGIAHDLNNILAAVLGQVELLRFRAADSAVQDSLNILETAAADGAHVVRRLQDFARQRVRSPLAPTDLAAAVQEALEITRPRWRDEPQQQGRIIEVRAALEGLPPILGHAPEVREAVTNLILNAVDAMPAGGALTLRGQRVNLPNSHLVDSSRPLDSSTSRPVDSPSEWVELDVTDTGSGMSEEVRRRIFEPFFTTKGVQGTGLGLSVVYGIMERHGGRIQVASSPGRGTTVTLRFLVAPGRTGEPREEKPSGASAGRRILLIDDEPDVREALADLLRAIGHQVTEAQGGAAGIAKLAEGQLDLVLTDLGMPGVTGWEVARAVKAHNPTLPVVLVTGWGDQAVAQAPERGLVSRVLAKPFRLEELARVIQELTGDPPPAGRHPRIPRQPPPS